MPKKQNSGCGCGSIPLSVLVLFLGLGIFGFTRLDDFKLGRFIPDQLSSVIALLPGVGSAPEPAAGPIASPPLSTVPVEPAAQPAPTEAESQPEPEPAATQPAPPAIAWESKAIRGIYLSRYQITNNASEQTVRDRVRYFKSKGFNTIIHGVWGNGCTMYPSEVMQQTFNMRSCPNQFQDPWLDWLIDEAHRQGMQVHAYFEKGIKLDENSPIFDEAIANGWIIPGVDRTYPGVDHYLLNVENPDISSFFRNILVEFVERYPEIDAVQWDDYLGYHDELPGQVDRTAQLTTFVNQMQADMKAANPSVSFDICHHNPYWGKRYFAADWENWTVDRAFIQVYNDDNFADELAYAEQYAGVAITEDQLHRLEPLINNDNIESILIFPASGDPAEAAAQVAEVAKAI